MASLHATIALIFDFDDTLVPDSTSRLLESHGINASSFWGDEVRQFVNAGFDPTLAYLQRLISKVGPTRPLGNLTRQALREFGATLDAHFFPGLPEFFTDLRDKVTDYKDIAIEFYIISGGLEDVILGSEIVKNNFTGVYGCQLAGDSEEDQLRYIRRAVTFTEKTRFLFEINKGLDRSETEQNPYLVNKDVPDEVRRIPFKHMIYVGDGLTDIPCFSLVMGRGGHAFGIFDPREDKSPKKALQELLKTDRVVSAHSPRFGQEDDLGAMLRVAVESVAATVLMERGQALNKRG